MRSRALLAVLALALPFALSAPPGSAPRSQSPEPLPWRTRGSPGGVAVATLLQLLREEENGRPVPPRKRDMHDFFVGLMGKRAAVEPEKAAGGGGAAAGTGHAESGPSVRCSPGPPPDGARAAGPPRPAL
ncbi:tachykinin-3-like isoform X1 [Coturnix japonica]|uniref:tachykinin-3-like isoform X1 n=1 Tax=Coturnix japonica TaxID=93934 RepID=UPI000777D4D4|nr:tachykinin-3-like isoform X1 [Coturnix japonica]XP_015742553.1 tachykinin-3-like isoform X1 [Coturnix japonica]XP_032296979.1 tachykinin-3-like isoform X1 [Coturnix japonica]